MNQNHISFDLRSNWHDIESELDAIGRIVYPRSVATLLNRVAWATRKKMMQHIQDTFDRPKRFTINSIFVDPAKYQDGDQMAAMMYFGGKQANYLWYQITGDTRRTGDFGSGRYDILFFAKKESQYGGAYTKSEVRKIANKNKKERKRRKLYRDKREAAAAAGKPVDKYRWNVVSKNDPGIFFGEVDGVEGYWQRSERYTAEEKALINSPRWEKSDGIEFDLLLGFRSTVEYEQRFDYDKVLGESVEEELTEEALKESLEYTRKKYLKHGTLDWDSVSSRSSRGP